MSPKAENQMPMITPEEIIEKARRHYARVLGAWISRDAFAPISFPVGKIPDDFATIRAAADQLKREEKYGYTVETTIRTSRKWGQQTFPKTIVIPTLGDYLKLIHKIKEFEVFCADISLIRARLPDLEEWIHVNPLLVIQYHADWNDLIEVCLYIQSNPQSGHSLRELPIPVHTKFIESHTSILRSLLDVLLPAAMIESELTSFAERYGLRQEIPQIRFRLLDHQFKQHYGLSLSDISVPINQANGFTLNPDIGIIVENKSSFLSLSDMPNTFAVFGGGFAVEQIREVEWLASATLLYWGDLDAQGFQILAAARHSLPNARITSVMMDRLTFDSYATYAVAGTPTSIMQLHRLSEEEYEVYLWLAERNLRLEQERLPREYVATTLNKVLRFIK